MMHTASAIALTTVILLAGDAAAAERPTVAAVAKDPKAYVGREVAFRNAACVDIPKGGFLCALDGGGQRLQIEASGLGASGGDIVAERLVGPCRGKDKLSSPTCRFDIEVKPISAITQEVMQEFEGVRAAQLHVGVIEMRVAGRR